MNLIMVVILLVVASALAGWLLPTVVIKIIQAVRK